ncbi:hypothetical protein ACWGH4_00110 [Streptomyces sp. NPDC054847]
MPQRYDDTWHQLEAADERAWLDQWARAQTGNARLAAEAADYHPVIIRPRPVVGSPNITR